MRFIKAVAGKFFQQIKQLGRLALGHVVFNRAFNKGFTLGVHFLLFLFTHGATQ